MTDRSADDVDIVFTFDTTGSMYPCLPEVRRRLRDTIDRLIKEMPGLRIGVVAHGDYCDADKTYVTSHLTLTDKKEDLINFVRGVSPTDGGDSPECYELVLNEVRVKQPWRKYAKKVVVLIGDDVPHGKDYYANVSRLDWEEEAKKLAEADIVLYPVQALGRRHATTFYDKLAAIFGTVKLVLDQFNQIIELITAVGLKQKSDEALANYAAELSSGRLMNRSIARMINALLGTEDVAPSISTKPTDLEAVHPSRFQILHVDTKISIRDFVQATGVRYQPRKGFYQWIKKETIQPYKHIVLRVRETGDMYTGDRARQMLNLPDHDIDLRPPKDILEKYVVFVESTSYNRKLDPGTLFLYEVEDFDR